MKVRKAIIPAAGLGTRFLQATKAMPKEMLSIVDKPTIQYVVEEAIESGIEDIIIVTGKGKRAIEDYFDNSFELEESLFKNGKHELLKEVQKSSKMVDIHYIRQKEAIGLGHAVWCARKFIGNEPFAFHRNGYFAKSPVKDSFLIEKWNEIIIASNDFNGQTAKVIQLYPLPAVSHLSRLHDSV